MHPLRESQQERRKGSITHDDLEAFRLEINASIEALKKVFSECQGKLDSGLIGAQEGYRKLNAKWYEYNERLSEIDRKVSVAVQGGDARLKDHEERLAELEKFRTEMKEFRSEMNSFKGMLESTSDSVSAMSTRFDVMGCQVNNIHDMVNTLAKKEINAPSPSISKSIISKIPWQAWLAISFGILLSVALVTGQLSDVLEIMKNSQKA